MSKICCNKKGQLVKLADQKKHLKSVKIYVLKYAQKSKMVPIEMYNLHTRLVQFKDQKKLKK